MQLKHLALATSSVSFLFFGSASASGQGSQSASDLMVHAIYLADLYNWADAETDFSTAEQMFLRAGDERNALHAHFGKIRAHIERDQRTLFQNSVQLASQLETNPLLKTDRKLRMFCLIVKGDIDTETDPRAMRDDWEQVEALARELGDMKWQNRAVGEIGVAAFYNGDVATARKNIGAALIAVTRAGDKAAQIRASI